MKKIVTVVGARPQFIKVAPVSRVLRQSFKEVLVHTGQHYDHKMAGVFFEQLNIPKPDYNLGVGSANHGAQTGEMIIKIEEVLIKEAPDAVLVYGDTNSTLAAAIAASKLHIPIFHIEAGLRSFNRIMPEEINRVLTDHVSSLLFAPTEVAVKNLATEGISSGVHNVGDVMYDAVIYNAKIAQEIHKIEDFGINEEFILATIHRAENTDDPDRLKAIFMSLNKLSKKVILPLHPRTEKKLKEQGLFDLVEHSTTIKIIEPAPYLEMLFLESNASAIVTDSGGVQKEAYFAKVPCFTLRDQTEWVETVNVGWNTLVNPINDDLRELVDSYEEKPYVEGLYGDGKASEKIVEYIKNFL
ncbi:non-hydrolyzing UDP-N-acetylglucosamine 2-epimerase [Ferdinandcohnia sp. SAFN-114]|uniref:non-hydrolyzing UDP-N-acetylglucosamine 2-epimerase n=1 Tax=Ferdinandcohnia sp. SAFN-114 TaxID=3387275 RepID=UPI003F81783B